VDRLIFNLLVRGLAIALRPFTGTWHALQDRFRGIGKSDWPTVTGVVFTRHVGQTERLWVAEVTYSYCAAGDYWSGEMRRPFALERDADDYATAHPNGSPVVVRYNPGSPGQSVVLAEDQRLASAAGTI
jgi:hypothetical protein